MEQTAYVKWLLQITRGDKDCLALQLAHDCCTGNAEAQKLLKDELKANPRLTRFSFYNVASQILKDNAHETVRA
jgi:hypothetical protein